MQEENKYMNLADLEVKKDKKEQKDLGSTIRNIENPIFRKNLQALFSQDEVLAAKLWGMGEAKKYDVFVGKDPIDINIINNQTLQYIYEKPVADVENLLNTVGKDYNRYPILFFYGFGNGIFYKALLANKTHQRVIVVEPEAEILFIVLNTIDLCDELLSQRLVLFLSEFATHTQFYQVCVDPRFMPYAKTYTLHIHTKFYENFHDDVVRINKDFAKALSQMVVAHGNSIDDMLVGIKHHIQNLPTMLKHYCYADLVIKRHAAQKTAIIVATGPSLDKQLETLKKFAPYATVISLDASYPILLKHGIKPDYVTSIERVEATSTFFNSKDKKIDKDIYFIIASLTHPKTIKNILPRKLVLTMRPQPDLLAFNMKKYGYLGIGHSTANQAYQLAYALGHENIVLIGQDLAFAPDGKSHATGHAFAQADEYLYVKAYGGEGEVRTTYIWDKFKSQYEKDIENSKREKINTYNCTEGGARIEGAIEKPFLDTMQELLAGAKRKKFDKIPKVSKKQSDADLLKAYNHILKKVQTQNKVRERIEKVFLEVVPKIDKLIKLKQEGKSDERLFEKLVAITDKIDKLKNFVACKKYKPMIQGVIRISVYYQELELAKISVAPSNTKEQKTQKLLDWVDIHKYWMFSAAGGLNADTEVTKKASTNLVKELKKRGLITKNEIGKAKVDFNLSI